MAYAKLTLSQALTINLARRYADKAARQSLKRELFAQVKDALGIPASTKLKVETMNTDAGDYLILKNSATGDTFQVGPDGRWLGAAALASQAQAPAPKRWFFLDKDDLRAKAAEQTPEFENGDDHVNLSGTAIMYAQPDLLVDEDGDVWIAMTESEFDNAY